MNKDYEVVDWFQDVQGLSVGVGDLIAYATCQSSTASLTVGKVLKIERHKWWTRYNPNTTHYDWRITVKGNNRTQNSRLEYPRRIAKLRSASEMEAAEHPARIISFGSKEYEA